ncbi:Baseplate wedge protein gp53, bacteriophage T4 [uncultured Caudovirales phage]|uniref:Baseplate wedge protein gp53, bacteriophage T4 n=1 Tax=uncultured Caudovirales phage TaxID=2100421 RepID=A0A6J5NUU9_9CAUD|nr:Baseplate wedge protein gp53, bacteriophage T4 [uncultured Caudovirales phage]
MVERYFEKFPIITYSNNSVVDITKRAVLLDKVYNTPLAFYPYTITSEERADQFSYRYYEDPFQTWIIYFSNKIVDPYYEWYLNNREFYDFMIKKYDSIDLPQQKIKHYKNDWETSENINVNGYDALTPGQKEYWEPVYGYNNTIVAYKRKPKDLIVNTNRICSYQVANSSNFIKDEICDIIFNSINQGKGQVLFSSNNVLKLQHISGTYLSNATVSITGNSYIFGNESNTNTSFISSTLSVTNIPADEEIYWAPVTYFEYETNKNEFNKTIRIIDKNFSQQLSDNLKTIMEE